jgi:plasmid stabilization system protein ParE
MKIIFSELAMLELDDACRFYDLQVPGLGSRFKEEVGKAARRIAEFPTAWSIERGEIRKGLLHMFPYNLLYSIEKDHVFIIAVAHQHRRPTYWQGR